MTPTPQPGVAQKSTLFLYKNVVDYKVFSDYSTILVPKTQLNTINLYLFVI